MCQRLARATLHVYTDDSVPRAYRVADRCALALTLGPLEGEHNGVMG